MPPIRRQFPRAGYRGGGSDETLYQKGFQAYTLKLTRFFYLRSYRFPAASRKTRMKGKPELIPENISHYNILHD